MKILTIAVALLLGAATMAQDSELRKSIDAQLAPRALLLTGGSLDSHSGRYIITFPGPNQCVVLGPIAAASRSFALYRAVSQGGFSLKPSPSGGLTVWTIEEWEALKKESWYAEFQAAHAKECASEPGKGEK